MGELSAREVLDQATDVRRVVVGFGEILAVIAPELDPEQHNRFGEAATQVFERLGIPCVVLPHGSDLAVVSDPSSGNWRTSLEPTE